MDRPLMMEPQEPPHEPPNPWVAGAASFFFPPLGHLYAGSAERGLLFLAALIVLGGAVPWAAAQSTGMGQAMTALWLVELVAMVVDAALTARRRSGAAPRWYQRAPFYVAAPALSFILVVATMLFVRAHVVKLYSQSSGSMAPTLIIGDRFFVDELTYQRKNPERGDVIVFRAPPEMSPEEHEFVKRVIGLPGDTVAVVPDTLLVDGKPAVEINDDPGNSSNFAHARQRGLRWMDRESAPRVQGNMLSVNGEPRVVVTPSGQAERRGGHLWVNGHRTADAGGPAGFRVATDRAPFGAAPGVQGSVYRQKGSDEEEPDPRTLIVLKGKRLTLRPGWVSINHRPLREPYARQTPRYEMPPYRIPAGHYFVLGDNRNDSNDSHAWGPLERKRIRGVVHMIFWSEQPERSGRPIR